jgi:hypothetical protein
LCCLFCFAVFPSRCYAGESLNWQNGSGFRFAELKLPSTGKTGFTRVPAELAGIAFTNSLADALVAQNRILENGSGVALGDVDGDGWCDIYFCRLEGPNALFRNLGDWHFQEITQSAGVSCTGQFSTGAVLADVDGDGDLDLLVNAIGAGTRCFLNDGKGRFTEMTDSRLVRRFGSTSMALADIDGDGDLDLYVTNYRTDTHKDSPPGLKVEARTVNGKIEVTPSDRFFVLGSRGDAAEVVEKGERDFLYLNDGTGRFAPVSWTAGSFLDEEGKPLVAPPLDWGLSVMFRDINGDGLPDIYVCNDFFFSPDRVWINEKGQRFRAIDRLAFRNMSASSMAVDFADIDRDGADDLIVVEMLNRGHAARQLHRENIVKPAWHLPIADPNYRAEVPRNTLFLNRGDGTYAEIAQHSGVQASDWSWGVAFVDIDLDGYEDLLVTTGNNHDVQLTDLLREFARAGESRTPEARLRQLQRLPRLPTAKLAFHNQKNSTFAETGREWGFDTVSVSPGMALADLDNDGDLDVVLNNLNSGAAIYRNDGTAPRVAVRLKGLAPNTRGIGAKTWLYGGAVPAQSQEMICGGRYLSGDDAVRVFAAGTLTNQMRIEVKWRSGKRSVVKEVTANRIYEVDEAGAGSTPNSELRTPNSERQPFFEDASGLIHHVHRDEPFDDFERQRLLPRRLSQLGPGVAWFDLDGDGREDLVIGAGRGGRMAAYRNDGRGGFTELTTPAFAKPLTRDQSGIAGIIQSSGRRILLSGSSNYEDGMTEGASVRIIDAERPDAEEEGLPGQQSSTGPVALADVDGDGDLDLFVGGRVVPRRYPQPASSILYRNMAGKFVPEREENRLFAQVGLVSGAVFSDLDGDGFAELLLACEWGPIRVFHNDRGKFREVTRDWGLDRYPGFWNGVTTGDFDGDGKLDIAASNWGTNTRYRCPADQPIRSYFGSFDRTGELEVIEAYFDPALSKIVPWAGLDEMSAALPFVREKFPTCQAYGTAAVDEILGNQFKAAQELRASWFQSAVFLNRGDRFEVRPLPFEAQVAPAFGITVGDMDGDGREDLFLAQNFFGVEPQTSRHDAGRGVWLKGDGRGNFVAVRGQESGVKVYGEQRGCALCDYDGDGRVDLVVTQNGAETKLYRNILARPGLRVRLKGPPGNPTGVGAVLRLKFSDHYGPAREVHAGSGYWSQDSAVQVLGAAEPPTQIEVRWPNGRQTTADVPAGAREIEVTIAERGR